MDYYLTLIRMARKKSGFFACGKDNDSNSTKICTYHLTNDMLNLITKKCYASGSDPFYKIEDFIEVDCRQFVKILKQLTNLGLDS